MPHAVSSNRSLDVLSIFAEARRPMHAADLAIALGMPRSECAPLLQSLVADGYLSMDLSERSYMPTQRVKGFGDWLKPVEPFEEYIVGCARIIHREFGFPTAVSHRAGLYIDWDFTLGLDYLERGSRLPALKTVNGIVSLSHVDDAITLNLIRAHNDRFESTDRVRTLDVIEQVNGVRGHDYGTFAAPLFPGDHTICFYAQDPLKYEELLLSVVVPSEDNASWEPQIVRRARKELASAMADAPVRSSDRYC